MPIFQGLDKMRVDNVSFCKLYVDCKTLKIVTSFSDLCCLQGEWLLTNIRDGKVHVEPADVEDALSEVLGLSYRYAC